MAALQHINFDMLNCFRDYKSYIRIINVSWFCFGPISWNSLWNNIIFCLSYTANTMPADARTTLRASASAGMVLTLKPEYVVTA